MRSGIAFVPPPIGTLQFLWPLPVRAVRPSTTLARSGLFLNHGTKTPMLSSWVTLRQTTAAWSKSQLRGTPNI